MISASSKLEGYFNIQPVYFEEGTVHKAIYIQQVHYGSTNGCEQGSGDLPKGSKENAIYNLLFRFLHV